MRLLPNVYQLCGNMYASHQNVYAVEMNDFLILVDTGLRESDLHIIEKTIQRFHLENKPIKFVLLTHEHMEHTCNAAYFQKQGAKIIAHEKAAAALSRGDYRIASYLYPELEFETFQTDIVVKDGQQLDLDGVSVSVIHTPGHSSGSVFYRMHVNGEDIVFSGDTILLEAFCHKVRFGWTGAIDYDEEEMIHTMQKISTIDADVLLPGHGEVCLYHAHRQFFGAWLRCRLDFVNNHYRDPLMVEVEHADK